MRALQQLDEGDEKISWSGNLSWNRKENVYLGRCVILEIPIASRKTSHVHSLPSRLRRR